MVDSKHPLWIVNIGLVNMITFIKNFVVRVMGVKFLIAFKFINNTDRIIVKQQLNK